MTKIKKRHVRKAIEEEKKFLAEKIIKVEDSRKIDIIKRYLSEYEYLLDEMPKHDFKPFERVLVRRTNQERWEYKLLYHEKFFEHLHMKRLVIDENIPFPVSTWERSYRYKGYGYNMCRETKKKLLQALKGVNVEEKDVSLYTTGGWD